MVSKFMRFIDDFITSALETRKYRYLFIFFITLFVFFGGRSLFFFGNYIDFPPRTITWTWKNVVFNFDYIYYFIFGICLGLLGKRQGVFYSLLGMSWLFLLSVILSYFAVPLRLVATPGRVKWIFMLPFQSFEKMLFTLLAIFSCIIGAPVGNLLTSYAGLKERINAAILVIVIFQISFNIVFFSLSRLPTGIYYISPLTWFYLPFIFTGIFVALVRKYTLFLLFTILIFNYFTFTLKDILILFISCGISKLILQKKFLKYFV